MGYYINHPDMSKEQWLKERAQPQFEAPTKHVDGDLVAVVLVDNGAFTAAGVAYDEHELAAFSRPDDYREKLWFMVPIKDVEQVIGTGVIKR